MAAALDLGIAIDLNGGTNDASRGRHVIAAPPFNATLEEIELISHFVTRWA